MIWLWALAGVLVILFLRGVLYNKYYLDEAIKDVGAYVLLLVAVVLGSHPGFWRENVNALWIAFGVGVALSFIGLGQMADVAGTSDNFRRLQGITDAYRASGLMVGLLPLLLLLCPYLRPFQSVTVCLGLCLSVARNLLAQKRLGMFMIVLLVLCFLWMLYRMLKQRPRGVRTKPAVLVGFLVFTMCASTMVVLARNREIVVGQAIGLLDRLTGRSKDGVAYKQGFLGSIGSENERWAIVQECLATFRPEELLFGRGMGGAAEWLSPGARRGDPRDIDQGYLSDAGFVGRRSFEVGIANPILKGGLILWGLVYLGYVFAALRSPSLLKVAFGTAMLIVLFLNLVQSVNGGDFLATTPFQTLTCGLCLGWCFRKDSTVNPLA